MFNLIRRDVIIQKWQILMFFPFILVFILMNAHPALTFLVASIFIPFNAFGYDEKAETNILLNSLPYTRRQIIASRYIGAIVYMALSVGITSLALYAFNKPFTLTDIAIGGGLFLLFAALTFPLYQIFKPGYITTVVLIAFILMAWATGPVILLVQRHLTVIIDFMNHLSNPVLYMGSTVVIVVLYFVSWVFSTILYQRKVF